MKTRLLKLLSLFLLTVVANGCKYPKGEGGMLFMSCYDCINRKTVYLYVDGKMTKGKLTPDYYTIGCSGDCPKDDSNILGDGWAYYIGPDGLHTYEFRDSYGTVHASGSFEIEKQECNSMQVLISGCTAGTGGGGGGGGGGSLPNGYEHQGTITVRSNNLSFCIRDFATIDGDKIDLVYNGQYIVQNWEVTGSDQCGTLSLGSGTNWIGVIAKDEGSIPPCTPGITINDGFSNQSFEIRSYVGGSNGAYIIQLDP